MYFIDEKELNAVKRVIEKKSLFRYKLDGLSECDQFEKEFSERIGSPYSIFLSSGTNALIAALGACGIGPGDEVILPAYTFAATAAAILNVGAIPVIANIDESLGIDPVDFESKITDRTRAVIPVHMDGLAANISKIIAISRKKGIFVVEDAAQSMGGSFENRRLGTWGDFGCFSLNENKSISCGEGGILVTSRREYYERAFCVHDNSAQFLPARREIFEEISPFMGSSMRVSEVLGAIMRVQLERLDGILERLRARKRILIETLGDSPYAKIILGSDPLGDCGSSFHLLFQEPETGSAVGAELRKKGVALASVLARPAHVCWKWMSLLGEKAAVSKNRNPYFQTNRKYSYNASDFLPSISILSRVQKMEIDIHLGLDETRQIAETVLNAIRHV